MTWFEMLMLDAVFPDELPECPPVFVCRLCRLGDVASMLEQKLLDVVFLEFFNAPRFCLFEGLRVEWMRLLGKQDVMALDGVVLRKNNSALNEILKLPDVARPFMAEKLVHRLRGEIRDFSFEFRCVFLQEMQGQQGDVLFALPQGRRQGG